MVNRSLTPRLDVSDLLQPLIGGFLDWVRVEGGFVTETISTYRRSVERFFTEASIFDVERITSGDVLRFKRLLLNRGCSPSYMAGMLLALRSFLTYCGEVRGLRVLDPKTIRPPKRPRRAVTY